MGVPGWTGLADAAADLFLGAACVGCATPGRAACASCRSSLSGPVRAVESLTADLDLEVIRLVRAAAGYEGPARDILLAHKEDGVRSLAPPLGGALAAAVASVLLVAPTAPADGSGRDAGSILLVRPPTARAKVRERGYDPLADLSRRAVRTLRRVGIDVALGPGVAFVRRTDDQAGLGAAARARNLDGAFGLRRRAAGALADRAVVLVDDVVTTGSTARDLHRVVTGAGASALGLATICATGHRD